jgi:type IV secretory pathway TrbF-like protein
MRISDNLRNWATATLIATAIVLVMVAVGVVVALVVSSSQSLFVPIIVTVWFIGLVYSVKQTL